VFSGILVLTISISNIARVDFHQLSSFNCIGKLRQLHNGLIIAPPVKDRHLSQRKKETIVLSDSKCGGSIVHWSV